VGFQKFLKESYGISLEPFSIWGCFEKLGLSEKMEARSSEEILEVHRDQKVGIFRMKPE
jgi:hypothetical protein